MKTSQKLQKQVAATSAAIKKFPLPKFLQNPTRGIPATYSEIKRDHIDHRKGKGIKFKMLRNPNNQESQ